MPNCPVCNTPFEQSVNKIKKYCSKECGTQGWVSENKEHLKNYHKEYNNNPINKQIKKEQMSIPEVKESHKKATKKWNDLHKKEIQENGRKPEVVLRKKQWYYKNKIRILKQKKEYMKRPEVKLRVKEKRLKNRPKILAKKREYEARPEVKAHRREYDIKRKPIRAEYERNRRKTDTEYKIRCNLNSRIRSALRGRGKKSMHTMELIGCSIDQLIKHIESLFKPDMSWDKFGQKGIHIDHIIPCCSFDLTDPEQQKICFHYLNLQPMWWHDNLDKRGKYNIKHKEKHDEKIKEVINNVSVDPKENS